ncbi:hypothetical protein [Alkalicoccobacillus gibsonii]|uniref:hypothetical protein n=1 Tax=Alkalicoccobacillus gibsonii TaxID=79881 RepID=UPI0019347D38|nr:hypothetical protein [Alkalicoccobacillus gibsonii]MBM0067942.1 hypothetical protein [Alkalicoccobacillus gibsonii]
MKKLLTTLSISLGSVILFSTGAFAQDNEEVPHGDTTLEEFTEIIEADADKGKEEAENLQTFNALSDEDKEKLINYLNDPEVIEEFADATMTLSTNEVQTSHNGDIVITHEIVEDDAEFSTMDKTRFRTFKSEQKVLDVSITSLYQQIGVLRRGVSIIGINGRSFWSTNLNPGAAVSGSLGNATYTATKATSQVVWKFTFAKHSPMHWSKIQTMNVDRRGHVSGNLVKNY